MGDEGWGLGTIGRNDNEINASAQYVSINLAHGDREKHTQIVEPLYSL